MLATFVEKAWQQKSLLSTLLLPVSWLYRCLFTLRKALYGFGVFKTHNIEVTVVVVGNLGLGGMGKTPLVIELAERLKTMGYTPGIVSRGYGGSVRQLPMLVTSGCSVSVVGDEAVLLAERTACPVMIDTNRARAATALLQNDMCLGIDVIVSDDGLQHYALGRDAEIVVHDPLVAAENDRLFPAGPWREPAKEFNSFDLCAIRGETYDLLLDSPRPVRVGGNPWRNTSGSVHAVAGIGNPERYFTQLEAIGYTIVRHAYPDHHTYTPDELVFGDDVPILMTEKDAVKCRDFDIEGLYYVPAVAELSDNLSRDLSTLLRRILSAQL